MKLCLMITALLELWAIPAAHAGIVDVAVSRARDDQRFDVVCRNGNREVDHVVDMVLGNVCPNPVSSMPTEMLIVSPRIDGRFDVVCRDHSVWYAQTGEKILSGNVCLPPVLESGVYGPTEMSPPYYDQLITVHKKGNTVTAVTIRLAHFSSYATLRCKGKICRGKWSYGDEAQIRIEGARSYTYGQVDEAGNVVNEMLFRKINSR